MCDFKKYLRFETGLLHASNSSELPPRVIMSSKGHMVLTSLALVQGTEELTTEYTRITKTKYFRIDNLQAIGLVRKVLKRYKIYV